jgi:hypothetical protein
MQRCQEMQGSEAMSAPSSKVQVGREGALYSSALLVSSGAQNCDSAKEGKLM